jgi:hypothetical protein
MMHDPVIHADFCALRNSGERTLPNLKTWSLPFEHTSRTFDWKPFVPLLQPSLQGSPEP